MVPDKVMFTQRQMDWLQKEFPELQGNSSTEDNELRWRAAQRSVVLVIAKRVQAQQGVPNGMVQ